MRAQSISIDMTHGARQTSLIRAIRPLAANGTLWSAINFLSSLLVSANLTWLWLLGWLTSDSVLFRWDVKFKDLLLAQQTLLLRMGLSIFAFLVAGKSFKFLAHFFFRLVVKLVWILFAKWAVGNQVGSVQVAFWTYVQLQRSLLFLSSLAP